MRNNTHFSPDSNYFSLLFSVGLDPTKQFLELLDNRPPATAFKLDQALDQVISFSLQSNNKGYDFSNFYIQSVNYAYNFDFVKISPILDMHLGINALSFLMHHNKEYGSPNLIDINVVKAIERSTLFLEKCETFSFFLSLSLLMVLLWPLMNNLIFFL